MSKKKRKAWATKIKPKRQAVDICQDCNAKYHGVIKDAQTGQVERVLSCRNTCPWRAR